MIRRSPLMQRSALEWAVRGILAVAALGIGWLCVSDTLGYLLYSVDPMQAHALAPGNGRITAQLARQMASTEAIPLDRERANRLALQAIRQDPTAVAAIATLGLNAQVRGDTAGARRLFAFAERLSRRDLPTQLWAVEDAVGRGDITGAIRHYDVALRTSSSAPNLLFPILASAIAEPSVRASLAGTLATKPNWGADFVAYVAGNSPTPRATASLFLALRRLGIAVPEQADTKLITSLVARNEFEPAWSYYSKIRPGSDRWRSRDPRFIADFSFPSPFDWVPVNDAGTNASIQRSDKGGLIDLSAPASVGGPLLRQLQLLPPGNYQMKGHSMGINQSRAANPYWTLTCPDGHELGRVVVPNSDQAGGLYTGRFSVPGDCSVQTLTLVARPSDAAGGLSGQIDQVQLAPAP